MATLGAPADDEDGVIELGAACRGVQDATLVGLENSLVSLNSDGKGLLSKGSLHLADVLLGHHFVVRDIDGRSAACVVLACARFLCLAGGVGISFLKLSFVALKIPEGVLLSTSVTAQVSISSSSAVNELLLREG